MVSCFSIKRRIVDSYLNWRSLLEKVFHFKTSNAYKDLSGGFCQSGNVLHSVRTHIHFLISSVGAFVALKAGLLGSVIQLVHDWVERQSRDGGQCHKYCWDHLFRYSLCCNGKCESLMGCVVCCWKQGRLRSWVVVWYKVFCSLFLVRNDEPNVLYIFLEVQLRSLLRSKLLCAELAG